MEITTGVFVEHKSFGTGLVVSIANDIARVRFSKLHAGKYVRKVAVTHLRVHGPLTALSRRVESRPAKTETVAERAMRDLLIGHIMGNNRLATRGLRGLLTLGRKASQGIFTPETTVYQPWLRKGRLGLPIHDSDPHTNFLTELEITK